MPKFLNENLVQLTPIQMMSFASITIQILLKMLLGMKKKNQKVLLFLEKSKQGDADKAELCRILIIFQMLLEDYSTSARGAVTSHCVLIMPACL